MTNMQTMNRMNPNDWRTILKLAATILAALLGALGMQEANLNR